MLLSRAAFNGGAPISLRIEPEIRAALQSYAAEEERSPSSYIARVLRQHVATRKCKKSTKSKS